MDDLKLVRKLKRKDQNAFEEVIEKFTPLVSNIIYNVSKGTLPKEDIEETVTDVFVTLWKNTDNIIEDKFKGYICCIA
ncbi:MAG: RNA polymerase subunit sigma-70, partial [Clostridia bacterium]|nr:RNA polymerase subunit sigma-70 [Clostridia bacterium]